MTHLSLEALPEAAHPVAQPELSDDVFDRYHTAVKKPAGERTHDDWAIVVAAHEDLTNYYSGKDEKVPQLRPPVQGGNVNQP